MARPFAFIPASSSVSNTQVGSADLTMHFFYTIACNFFVHIHSELTEERSARFVFRNIMTDQPELLVRISAQESLDHEKRQNESRLSEEVRSVTVRQSTTDDAIERTSQSRSSALKRISQLEADFQANTSEVETLQIASTTSRVQHSAMETTLMSTNAEQ
jgi:hypothetical protein